MNVIGKEKKLLKKVQKRHIIKVKTVALKNENKKQKPTR